MEPLTAADLESEIEDPNSSPFGTCKPEHITYAIKIVEIARIRRWIRLTYERMS